MKKLVDSGVAFLIAGLLCIVAGLTAENGLVFFAAGGIWLILAVVARARIAKKRTSEGEKEGGKV